MSKLLLQNSDKICHNFKQNVEYKKKINWKASAFNIFKISYVNFAILKKKCHFFYTNYYIK